MLVLFSSFPVLASAVCLCCCCHFDMSNRLVASLFFSHVCLFYFVFSCCCFDKPRTSFVCSVDYVKLEVFKMVDVLTFHYSHKSESWRLDTGVAFPVQFSRICVSQRCDVGLSPSMVRMLHKKVLVLFCSTRTPVHLGCSIGDETTQFFATESVGLASTSTIQVVPKHGPTSTLRAQPPTTACLIIIPTSERCWAQIFFNFWVAFADPASSAPSSPDLGWQK